MPDRLLLIRIFQKAKPVAGEVHNLTQLGFTVRRFVAGWRPVLVEFSYVADSTMGKWLCTFADMAHSGRSAHLQRPKDDEVHVWTIRLSQLALDIPVLSGLLAPDERQKAARFLRDEDRMRFIVAHGVLRQLLGGYLSAAPEELGFTVNDFGKPALVQRIGDRPLTFNLAHSGDVILCGVANGQWVGVDVEAVRDDLAILDLAEGQFSTREIAALKATPASERTIAFFRCWTRKEAYLKARGEGLGFPLNQFSVTFGTDESPMVHWAADDPLAMERWTMFDLVPAPGYAGAVVVDTRRARIMPCTWPLQA